VLGVVEHGQQHVQVVERVGQADLAGQPQVQVRRRAPLGWLQGLAGGLDGPAERLEDAFGQLRAALTAQRRYLDAERDPAFGELGLGVAATGQRGPEGLLEGHRQHAGSGVRAVVDVLGELPVARFRPAADQGDGVDLEHQRGGAAPGGRLGIKDVRRTRRGLERLQPVGVLVQQVPEVRRGRPGGGDRQQHTSLSLTRSGQIKTIAGFRGSGV
jgi:hypothetical protein